MSQWGKLDLSFPKSIVLLSAFFIGGGALLLLHYLSNLILHLTIVETSGQVFLPLRDDPEDNPDSGATPATSNQRITSSVRRTLSHLRSILGRTFPFHGLGATFVANFSLAVVSSIFSMFSLPSFITLPLAALATAKLSMSALHAQISSTRGAMSVFSRMKKLEWSDVLTSLTPLMLSWCFAGFLGAGGWTFRPAGDQDKKIAHGAFVALLLAILGLVMWIARAVVEILLVRVQASAFPVGEDSIVSIDQTFGIQKDGEGPLTMLQAAKGMTREDMICIVKMWVKLTALVVVYTWVFLGVLVTIYKLPF